MLLTVTHPCVEQTANVDPVSHGSTVRLLAFIRRRNVSVVRTRRAWLFRWRGQAGCTFGRVDSGWMMRRIAHVRGFWLGVALLLTSSCGGSDSAATTSSVGSGSTAAGVDLVETTPSADMAPVAAYLAVVYEVDAELVEAQASTETAADPLAMLQLFDDAIATIAALSPPPEAQEFHSAYLGVNGEFADAMRVFADAATGGDDVAAQAAAFELMVKLGELGGGLSTLAALQADLATSVLSSRPGDPEAVYLVEMMALGQGTAEVVEDLLSALATGSTDPFGLIEELADLTEVLEEVSDDWQDLDPPTRFAQLQARQTQLITDYVRTFDEFLRELASGEEPSFATVFELQSLAAEAPALNAQWSRAIAAKMHEIAG